MFRWPLRNYLSDLCCHTHLYFLAKCSFKASVDHDIMNLQGVCSRALKLSDHYDKATLQPYKSSTPSVSLQGIEPGIVIIGVKKADIPRLNSDTGFLGAYSGPRLSQETISKILGNSLEVASTRLQ